MRIEITFRGKEKTIALPFRYPELVQGMIYRHLPAHHAEKLHNQGFLHGKRRFKLFTFSRILGETIRKPPLEKHQLIFRSPIRLLIASPIEWLLPEFAEALLRSERILLGSQSLWVEKISVYQPVEIQPPLRLKMLSPVTIYSTVQTATGKKKTYYYSPREAEFSELLTENARKKLALLYRTESRASFTLTPVSRPREHPIIYKGTLVKAYSGIFEATGDAELLRVTYECGLGSKNSQGFGMWEVLPNP